MRRPSSWLEDIRWGVLDLSGPYRAAFDTAIPDAGQVADPFHVVRLGNTALDEVRRRVQNQTLGHRGHKHDPLYRARKLLVSASETITDSGRVRLRGLLDAGDPYGEVRDAWHAKETLRSIYDIDDAEVGAATVELVRGGGWRGRLRGGLGQHGDEGDEGDQQRDQIVITDAAIATQFVGVGGVVVLVVVYGPGVCRVQGGDAYVVGGGADERRGGGDAGVGLGAGDGDGVGAGAGGSRGDGHVDGVGADFEADGSAGGARRCRGRGVAALGDGDRGPAGPVGDSGGDGDCGRAVGDGGGVGEGSGREGGAEGDGPGVAAGEGEAAEGAVVVDRDPGGVDGDGRRRRCPRSRRRSWRGPW